MKTIQMKYGKGHVDVSVPAEKLLGIIEKQVPKVEKAEAEIIQAALAAPIGTSRLRDIVKPGQTVAIVVSDITRLWQRMFVYLPHIVSELNAAGIEDKDIRFIGATGFHRKMSASEHAAILGEALSSRFEMVDHDCQDTENLVSLGTTKAGTPVFVNKTAMACDHIVLTGCCTYHPFVGWGGGKKSILPGIAGFETIQHNHFMCLTDEIGGGQRDVVRNANFEGNPVHEDMMDAAAFVAPSFMFNVVMGYDGKIAHAVAGDYDQAHRVGCNIVEDMWGVPISELGDLVIASQGGFPKDIEFYQTGKAIYHAQDAIKPGGTMIVLSECPEGLGPEHAKEIFLSYNTTVEREKAVRSLFSVPKYVSYYICEASDKYDVIVVSAIDPALLAKTRIRVVTSVEEALNLVYKEKGTHLKTYLMPLGSSVLPILKKNQQRKGGHGNES
ncbi:MAG: nickel-dependent lactate racemase [Myxococcota bacterium]|nr:nickel-dependent lactate racemase [Myxococcota bacterium]